MQGLSIELIIQAYAQGYFPMADEFDNIEFYRPKVRALFPITGIHVSKSLARVLQAGKFEVRFDTCFEQVMRSCIRPAPQGNWINEEIINIYCQIHELGWGHCAEVYLKGELVGGAYGICLGAAFFGEAMFHKETNASKVAVHALVKRCQELGFDFVDAQVPTPHLASLGAYEMRHADYLKILREALLKPTPWSPVYFKE